MFHNINPSYLSLGILLLCLDIRDQVVPDCHSSGLLQYQKVASRYCFEVAGVTLLQSLSNSEIEIMATIIYKRYFKTAPSQPEPCDHQRPVADIEDGFPNTNSVSDSRDSGAIPLKDINHNQIQPQSDIMDSSKCPICQDEKRTTSKYRWKLIAGLFLPFLIQSLDTTIIASALPFIGSEFRKYPTCIYQALLT